jgi:hypothetical protein
MFRLSGRFRKRHTKGNGAEKAQAAEQKSVQRQNLTGGFELGSMYFLQTV